MVCYGGLGTFLFSLLLAPIPPPANLTVSHMNVPFAHGITSQGSALCLKPGKALVNIVECHVSVGVSKKLCLYPTVAPPVLEAAQRELHPSTPPVSIQSSASDLAD